MILYIYSMSVKEPNTIVIDGQVYEIPSKEANSASAAITWAWNKLGKPTDPFSKSGEKLMDVIISVWQDLYPQQAKQWFAQKKEYQLDELSTHEQVKKKTGRSLASVPTPIYKIMRAVFPEFKMNNRDDFMKLIKKYPVFRMANKA